MKLTRTTFARFADHQRSKSHIEAITPFPDHATTGIVKASPTALETSDAPYLPHTKVPFGYKEVNANQKQQQVNSVFTSVAPSYDIMNDLMSGGVHRVWKHYLIQEIGILKPERIYSEGKVTGVRPVKVLDMSAGTGDIAFKIVAHQQQYAENPNSLASQLHVTLYDPNEAILAEAKRKAASQGIEQGVLDFKIGTAEDLSSIESNSIDLYVISFGLRNTTSVDKALQEARRVLRRGGRFVCLEFSKVNNQVLKEFYRLYSFNVIPLMGQVVAGDRDSYQYLVESIDRFYDQEQLLQKLRDAGFSHVSYENLTFGVVAIHSSYKL